MVNEDIITALKNAVNRGESLEVAINTMITSGYSKKDVQEAASFVGGGVLSNMEANPDEQLTMPSGKTLFGKPVKPLPKSQPLQQPQQQIQQPAVSVHQSRLEQIPGAPQQQPQQQIQQPQQPTQPLQLSKPQVQPRPALPNDPIKPPPTPPELHQQTAQPAPAAILPQLPNDPNVQQPQPQQGLPLQFTVQDQSIQKPAQQTQSISEELQKIKPKKATKSKEIILLLILLCLVGVLIVTIVFREKIIGLFSA